ncbi:MAG: recombinase family protein [Rickettsiaceae bacterium]
MSKLIGYARISSSTQNLDSQIDLLNQAGCAKIFTDKITGTKKVRVGWNDLMSYIRSEDTLVITEFSRMSRSLPHLLELVKEFENKNIHLISLRENIDTSSPSGRAFLSIIGAISQMELEIRSERAKAGRDSAKARGKTGGRPKINQDRLEQASILYKNSDKTAKEIAKIFGFSRRALFSYLKKIPPTHFNV